MEKWRRYPPSIWEQNWGQLWYQMVRPHLDLRRPTLDAIRCDQELAGVSEFTIMIISRWQGWLFLITFVSKWHSSRLTSLTKCWPMQISTQLPTSDKLPTHHEPSTKTLMAELTIGVCLGQFFRSVRTHTHGIHWWVRSRLGSARIYYLVKPTM